MTEDPFDVVQEARWRGVRLADLKTQRNRAANPVTRADREKNLASERDAMRRLRPKFDAAVERTRARLEREVFETSGPDMWNPESMAQVERHRAEQLAELTASIESPADAIARLRGAKLLPERRMILRAAHERGWPEVSDWFAQHAARAYGVGSDPLIDAARRLLDYERQVAAVPLATFDTGDSR